jgi:RNA polymerase sigma-70 factor, ECF subfamily
MALSETDRNLLDCCFQRKPGAWEGFVDRFMGVVLHVVNHTARAKNIQLSAADRDALCRDVFSASIENDFALLREYHGKSSLATYLTVVARRIVVKELIDRSIRS